MNYFEVAPIQIIRSGSASFTYSSNDDISIGSIVLIEVGKKKLVGLVIKAATKPIYPTKPILELVEQTPLPRQLVELALWISSYYVTPLATTLQTILPRGLQKNRRKSNSRFESSNRVRTKIVFNKEQRAALDSLEIYRDGTFLLEGITGSGKTEIYIEVAKKSIESGRSTIVLVPEIALTSQLIAEFSHHFTDIIVTHSKLTESERHQIWLEALNSDKPQVVIGPRSALFMPLKDIGAIIVDEAHEPSFKQEQAPRYSALRVATILGRFHTSKVIFGSATPSISDRYLAEQSNRPILRLTKLARKGSVPPATTLVDMTKRENFSNHRFLSKQLVSQITATLEQGKQTLLFHNRRGSTSTTLCMDCGWTAECPRCYLPLTLHADQHKMRCHICDYKADIPTSCPVCGGADIIHKGVGTKLIESEIRKLFPAATVARFDADSANDETVNALYGKLYDGSIDIVIGTQTVAKGLDLPHLRTVGVIQADSGLALPDFSSSERTFQLLAQVIGRVGRNEHQTQVIVQTYQPTHHSVTTGIVQNYEEFYSHTLAERRRGLYPPFTHLLKLTCVYKTESAAIGNAKKLAADLRSKVHKDVRILGPAPAFYERQHDTYRWQLTLKSPKREHLINALSLVPATHWQSELDPTSLL